MILNTVMEDVFENLFSEMLITIAGTFSQQQQNFLRFVLRETYEDLTRHHIQVFLLVKNDPHQQEASLTLTNKLRTCFNLLPINPTETETQSILARQERFKQRWKELAISKGIN